jgi:bacterioferritin
MAEKDGLVEAGVSLRRSARLATDESAGSDRLADVLHRLLAELESQSQDDEPDISELLDALNDALNAELLGLVKVTYARVLCEALGRKDAADRLGFLWASKLEHARRLAARVSALGGPISIRGAEVESSGDLHQALEEVLKAEKEAGDRIKEHIKTARALDDPATRLLLETILLEKEEQLHTLATSLLG